LTTQQKSFDSADKSITQQTHFHSAQNCKLYNKLEDNFHLSNKKALFLNMKIYYEAFGKDVFGSLPVTFHVKEGVDSPEWNLFKEYHDKCEADLQEYKNRVAQSKQD